MQRRQQQLSDSEKINDLAIKEWINVLNIKTLQDKWIVFFFQQHQSCLIIWQAENKF